MNIKNKLAIILFFAPLTICATELFVKSGETYTNNILSDGDVIVEEGGVIDTNGSAIDMPYSNNRLLNKGSIRTTIDFSPGIRNTGNNTVIINSGSISTRGFISYGGLTSYEIYNNTPGNTIINTGFLSTGDMWAFALLNDQEGVVMINEGKIFTSGDYGYGIYNRNGDGSVIKNSGLISTIGSYGHGIVNWYNDDLIIKNSGEIEPRGFDANGIKIVGGDNLTIINSGTISSAQAHAIHLYDLTNPSLRILRGSNIQGAVYTSSPIDLFVQKGVNLFLSLDPTGASFDALTVKAPHAQNGYNLAVIDITGLAMQPDIIADLADSVLNNIYHHRLGSCFPCERCWAQGFGSYRSRGHHSAYRSYDNRLAGFLTGCEKPFCKGFVSLFGGVSCGRAEIDKNTQHAHMTSYITGASYEKPCRDTFFGLTLAGGYIDWHNSRYVMNNLANRGEEKAVTDVNAYFFIPEATLSRRFHVIDISPVASLSLRYAGLYLNHYHEKGSSANLAVKDRDVELLTARIEGSSPSTYVCAHYCQNIEPYTGFLIRRQIGGRLIKGYLLGHTIHFDQEGPKNIEEFFLGLRASRTWGKRLLYGDIEGGFDSKDSRHLLVETGITW